MLFGTVVATMLIVVVTAQIALDTAYWTVFNHITIWGSLVVYFMLQFAYNYLFTGEYIGTLDKARPSFSSSSCSELASFCQLCPCRSVPVVVL